MSRPTLKISPLQWLYCLTALFFTVKVWLLPNPSLDYPGVDIVQSIVLDSGVPNAVTGIIFRNRLYDTIFEVLVFTIAIMGVSYLMANEKPLGQVEQFSDQPSIVLARLGATITALVSIELAIRGHLSPGGGFAAGVAGGTAIGLVAITASTTWMEQLYQRWQIGTWEKVSVLVFIVLAGLTFGGWELAQGEFGALVSGGMIPILNALVAFKVALGSWAAILIFIRYRGLL
ncbi:Na(+)/H(+) antiporter subunit B [Thermosynechococcaceae cyanobacterium BACA0444]|uniref:Na(+)/H(+) antiporter subunit B n=1 Tax=Pseudocalidococcus azoricus BACA0444 TaxID=2918990 RepID=A0AAE4FT48_9CYAN|nr:Na(+)/H(+) antiporter subunit B [Pseudocalidococcus azoricus]MDS3860470.1 Na(+)/H(+) antiporter subunit B [Pseudocalidococcus azoricus BACA0444]